MTTVVVYKLEDLCYYICNKVPQSTDAKYDDLMNYIQKSEWITYHPVQYIVEIRELSNMEDVVIEYMKRYGLNNVRASFEPYHTLQFSAELHASIQKKIEDFVIEKKKEKPAIRLSGKVDYYAYAD